MQQRFITGWKPMPPRLLPWLLMKFFLTTGSRSLRINEDLKKVSVDDVNKAFNKYVKDITWVYQGDTSKVNPALYTGFTSGRNQIAGQ